MGRIIDWSIDWLLDWVIDSALGEIHGGPEKSADY